MVLYGMNVFIFIPAYPLERIVGTAALGDCQIPCGFKQFQVVLLGTHEEGTKEGRRCNHDTWYVDELWASGTCLANSSWDILDTWPNQPS